MRTFVVGDIHGCHDEFSMLLNQLDTDWRIDRLILLGDYIDRGPKSWEVISSIMSLQETFGKGQIIALRGNHEQMAIDYHDKGECNWLHNGGRTALESLAANGKSLDDAIRFFKELPLYYEDSHHIFVHAGIRIGVPMAQQAAEDLLWIRDAFFRSSRDHIKTIVFGHTPTATINGEYTPIQMTKKIAMDTACVYDGVLSIIEIDCGRILNTYQTKNKTWRNQCA